MGHFSLITFGSIMCDIADNFEQNEILTEIKNLFRNFGSHGFELNECVQKRKKAKNERTDWKIVSLQTEHKTDCYIYLPFHRLLWLSCFINKNAWEKKEYVKKKHERREPLFTSSSSTVSSVDVRVSLTLWLLCRCLFDKMLLLLLLLFFFLLSV